MVTMATSGIYEWLPHLIASHLHSKPGAQTGLPARLQKTEERLPDRNLLLKVAGWDANSDTFRRGGHILTPSGVTGHQGI